MIAKCRYDTHNCINGGINTGVVDTGTDNADDDATTTGDGRFNAWSIACMTAAINGAPGILGDSSLPLPLPLARSCMPVPAGSMCCITMIVTQRAYIEHGQQ